MKSRLTDRSQDPLDGRVKAVAMWCRRILPIGRGGQAISLPRDVMRAMQSVPGESIAYLYQIDEQNFHIHIIAKPELNAANNCQ